MRHKKFIKNKQVRKLSSPPKPITIAPILPPDDICRAPAIPVAVPDWLPVEDTPPIIQFATEKPLPSPNNIIGNDMYKGWLKPIKCITRIEKYDNNENEQPKTINLSMPSLAA